MMQSVFGKNKRALFSSAFLALSLIFGCSAPEQQVTLTGAWYYFDKGSGYTEIYCNDTSGYVYSEIIGINEADFRCTYNQDKLWYINYESGDTV
jgi:hypothetical protein